MILKKWNYDNQEYDLVDVGEGNFKTYTTNMNEIVNCPHCKKEFKYGDGYTSKEFHTNIGFGYVVCSDCYFNNERLREMNYKKNKEE